MIHGYWLNKELHNFLVFTIYPRKCSSSFLEKEINAQNNGTMLYGCHAGLYSPLILCMALVDFHLLADELIGSSRVITIA